MDEHKNNGYSEEQIIRILMEVETGTISTVEASRKYGIQEATLNEWSVQYRGWLAWKKLMEDPRKEPQFNFEYIDEVFHHALTLVTALKFNLDISLLYSYQLAELDGKTRTELKDRVKSAMAAPRDTGAYQLVMKAGHHGKDPAYREERALRFVELEGLLVLGMLGDKSIIPTLLARLREEPKENTRMNITANRVLRYLTGQEIGGYILSDDDLALWEAWWQNANASHS